MGLLDEIKYEKCPFCGSGIQERTQSGQHTNGHWNESVKFWHVLATFILLVICCLFSSCGVEPPVMNDEHDPFIVGEIKQRNSTHSIYIKDRTTHRYTSFSSRECIVLPTGVYNVGDTINMNDFLKNRNSIESTR